MSEARRARAPWAVWAVGQLLLAATLLLSALNGSFREDPLFIPIAIAMMLGYTTIGAIVASRDRSNALGWLMMWVGVAFALAGLVDEYATYAYRTEPGALPFRIVAAWLTNWAIILVVSPIPILLTLFHDGRPPSRGWRLLPAAVIASAAVLVLGSVLSPGLLDNAQQGIAVRNPTGAPSLGWLPHGALWLGGLGLLAASVASIVALVLRFRRAEGEERQQVRWLAYAAAVAGITLVLAIVSGIGLHGEETRFVNDLAFFLFFASLALGFPAAIGVAVLRYRLWDLDIVVKKAVVFAVVVTALTLLGVLVLVLLPVAVLGTGLSGWERGLFVVGIALGVLVGPLRRRAQRIADRVVYGGRATPYEILTEFSGRMAEAYSTEDVLPRMAGIVGAGTGAERVVIWLQVGRELRHAARWPAGSADDDPRPVTALVEGDPGTFEVRHRGELLGAITVTMPSNDPMDPAKERLIRDLASQAGLVLRNVRLIEELRASRRRLVAAQDAERRRLERNIHDGAQQQLVALAVKLRLADQMVGPDPGKARELLAQLQTQAGEMLEDLRDLARGIYPPLLADQGLAVALQAQARKVPLPIEVTPDGMGRYDQEVEAAVYFCVLEALQNIMKYAGASHVEILLRDEGPELTFTVGDDGVGFDRGAETRGTGLQGMADRLDAVGGSFEVRSAPGRGTTVLGRVPVR